MESNYNSPFSSTNSSVTGTNTGPNSPELDKAGKQHMPAITSIGQAIALVKALEVENKDRTIKNARIQNKLNAERPFEQTRLEADGLGWKSNFTTKPLSSLADKVVPRFTTAIDNMRYLTASKLPDRFPGADAKTEAFRREVTETARGREGFSDLMSEIVQENVLFGYTAASWLNQYVWFPRFHRQDDFLAARNTKHTAKTAPVACFREKYLVHELFEMISDLEAAKINGWDTDEVINSINAAVPANLRSNSTDPLRLHADLQRESAVLTSFVGSKGIDVWHVLVAEVDGLVTHVAYDQLSEKCLFWKEKKFSSMSDATSFYSFQHGNGNIHGSKGIGRELYAMAGILDRSRNEVVDRLQLSGKLVIACEEKDIKRFRMSVVGNAILIANGYAVQQQKIDGNVEPFFQLDSFLTNLLDQIAGSTSPKPNEGERVTKAAVEINAAREEERRDALIGRFLKQFARMFSTVQRRMCDANTSENDAKEMQKRLLAVMTREELDYLCNQPAVSTIEDYSDQERQQIVLISQEAKGNPLYNAYGLERRKLTALIDSEFADAVLLPQNDPTEQAENERQQLTELLIIQSGQDCPVSPRDNHAVHLSVCQKAVSKLIPQAAQDPSVWPLMAGIGDHMQPHISAAEQAGQAKEVADFKSFLTQLDASLKQLMAHQQQVVQQHIESQPAQPPAPTGDPAADAAAQQAHKNTQIKESIQLNYKDAPPSIKRQIEQAYGFTPAPDGELPEAPKQNIDPNNLIPEPAAKE